MLDYLIVYVQKGHCRFTVDHEQLDLHSGQFCLIQPASLVVLEGLTDTTTPFMHLDVFYNPDRELSFPTKQGQVDLTPYSHLLQPSLSDVYEKSVPILLEPKNPSKLSQLMVTIVEYFQHREPIIQLKAQCLAMEVIIMVLEDHLSRDSSHQFHPNSLHWTTSYFANNLSEPITLNDMAKRANLSPSWFNVVFKRTYGVSPHQFLLTMRIDHAKDLLQTTEYTLEDIASYCGFSDIFHFSKIFKQKTGKSPGLYREITRHSATAGSELTDNCDSNT